MIITDPKTEEKMEIMQYLKQNGLLIDESKYPFKHDFDKCRSCQFQDGQLLADGTRTHLCGSCQWHLSGVSDDLRRNHVARSQLRYIQDDLSSIGITVYFDTDSIGHVINMIKEELESEKHPDRQLKLNTQLLRLEQIVGLGLKWESGY